MITVLSSRAVPACTASRPSRRAGAFTTLSLLALLSACGGGSDGTTDAAAAASTTTTTTTTNTTTNTTTTSTTVASGSSACSGKVASFFASAAGSYTGKAATFDNVNFASTPATVAGFANGSTQTVVIGADCTVTVGGLTLSYKDASYAEFPGTGADAGKTQVDVDLTGTGVDMPHFERWTDMRRGLSFFDPAHSSWGVRIDES